MPFLDYMLYRHASRGRIVQNIGGIANLSAIPAGATSEQVLAVVPGGFPESIARLKKVVSSPGGVVAVFGHGLQVRLGTAGSLDVKLHVAARVLARMGGSIRRSVAYVDVSAPARPAIGYKK